MESAKRASEIHKKRTGRYYRITEETVINEQMYEEEDDTPRFRLHNQMQFPNTLLQQRAQAMMSIQMENRKLLGQAVNSTLQHNPQFQNQSQFISPGMMQMPQGAFNFTMPSPQMNHSPQTPTNYQHSPYPTPTEPKGPGFHQRSASTIEIPRHYGQSAQSSPLETQNMANRRMSLPPQNNVQQSPQFKKPSYHVQTGMSQQGSYPTTPTYQQQPQHQQDNSNYDGSVSGHSPGGYDSYQSMGPLTTSLPRDTQQLLDSGLWPNMNNNGFSSSNQNQSNGYPKQQPFYIYRPNSTSKMRNQQATSTGLNQTLLATASENSAGGMGNNPSTEKQPTFTNSGGLSSNTSEHGFDLGFDDSTDMFGFGGVEAFNAFASGPNSAQPTPHDEWASFLDNDMFNDMQSSAGA